MAAALATPCSACSAQKSASPTGAPSSSKLRSARRRKPSGKPPRDTATASASPARQPSSK
eukprot:6316279-Pyramimonas_sp.AAC.1